MLQISDEVKLKINFNNTRRSKFFTKLGYQTNSSPITIPLDSIHLYGGIIGCVKFFVARIYPIRYMEQMGNVRG